MEEVFLKIHNSERMKKVEAYTKNISNRRNRPHAYYKNFTYLQIPKIMSKYGYEYKTENETLQELQSSFKSKCEVYFNKTRVVKLGRMDKIRLKEELNFEIKSNPVLRFFNKLNEKLVVPKLS
jgi:hypothetical protein